MDRDIPNLVVTLHAMVEPLRAPNLPPKLNQQIRRVLGHEKITHIPERYGRALKSSILMQLLTTNAIASVNVR